MAVISDREAPASPIGEGLTRFPNLIRISKRSPPLVARSSASRSSRGIFSTAKGTLIRSVNTIESISGNLGYRTRHRFARLCFLLCVLYVCVCVCVCVCARERVIPVYVARPEYRAALQPRQKCLTSGYLVENGLLTRHRHFPFFSFSSFSGQGKKRQISHEVRRKGDDDAEMRKIKKGGGRGEEIWKDNRIDSSTRKFGKRE